MLWATVWTLLGVGTLVGGFYLVRDVARRGARTLAALEEASQVIERLDQKVAELDALRPAPEPYAPDVATARARRAELRALREERARRRQERHRQTIESWRRLTR